MFRLECSFHDKEQHRADHTNRNRKIEIIKESKIGRQKMKRCIARETIMATLCQALLCRSKDCLYVNVESLFMWMLGSIVRSVMTGEVQREYLIVVPPCGVEFQVQTFIFECIAGLQFRQCLQPMDVQEIYYK